MVFIYCSRILDLSLVSRSSWMARYCSWILRFTFSGNVFSWVQVVRTVFLISCWVMVLAPSVKWKPLVIPTTPARMMP